MDSNIVEMSEYGFCRTLPHNITAEKAVLGAILAAPTALEQVAGILTPSHFALDTHASIFAAMTTMRDRGRPVDATTLKRFFEADSLAEIGGAKYLVELIASAVSVMTACEYALHIVDCARRRSLVALGEGLLAQAYSADVDATARDIIATTEEQLAALADAPDTGAQALAATMPASLEAVEAASRGDGPDVVKTGLAGLDKIIGGLAAPDLVVLAGRPAMGKTALAVTIAHHVARTGKPVAFFSLEMSAHQLNLRLLSMATGIDLERLRSGEVGAEELPGLHAAAATIADLPLYIDDTAAPTAADIRSRARKIQRKHGISLVVIDYLQLLRPPDRYAGQRVHEVGEMSASIKGMAKDLDAPVILLSQLSRAVEARDDHRPRLSDLRDSGSIEQDADIVGFIFREEYYLRQAEPQTGSRQHEEWLADLADAKNKATVIVAKQRQGPTGRVDLHWDASCTKFGNLAR
jgi:replicative DNA helicase